MTNRMKSTSTLKKVPREFVAKSGTPKGAVAKAVKTDEKQDKALAKRFGVKYKG